MKMEKTPRYTQRERNMVLGYAAQYKDVIENKRTDAESNRKKDEVWRQIAKEFNARVYHQRSAKQLRQLYKNMKLLLKKDLCGDEKGNRTFMDLLNTLSQQESVAQYISEQISPGGSFSSNGRLQKYEDDFEDSKMPLSSGYGNDMDGDVIVIKSEDISDNEHSQQHDEMDEDDDDCLSAKDIPEVCLEEEDDELFTDSTRRSPPSHNNSLLSQLQQQQQQQQQQQEPKPEVTIQNVGNIRVGSIGSLANLSKALQNSAALSITSTNSGNNNNSLNNSSTSIRQTSAEQAQQQLLLNGLGLSAVHQTQQQQQQAAAAAAVAALTSSTTTPQMPQLQRGGGGNNTNSSHNNNNSSNNTTNSTTNAVNQLLLNLANSNNFSNKLNGLHLNNGTGNSGSGGVSHHSNNHYNQNHQQNKLLNSNSNSNNNNNNNNSDYLMFLEIEEKRRKIDLLNAQTEYWKTLTKKLETSNGSGHFGTPTCSCHFTGGAVSNGMPAKAGNNS